LRGFVDDRNETIGKKIRDNEVKKSTFYVNCCEKEEAEQKVALRARGKGDIGSFRQTIL